MRVLIADRNARLLESISRTFAQQFSIQTASTRKHCGDLLRQGEFDVAIISEKLADGPGLQLIGQIARSSPDTLRIFAARRTRLQLLKGKLGPFGLFRTLAYPIDAQKLLSALTLARVGLEIDVPSPAAMRPTVKRVSPTFTPPALSINVPMTIASMRRNRPSESLRAPQPAPLARQVPGISPGVRSETAKSAASSQIVSRSSRGGRQLAAAGGGRPRSLTQTPPLGSLSEFARRATAVHPTQKPQLVQTAPKRMMVPLGVAITVVFLVTTLTLRLFDASAAPSSSAQATRISRVDSFSAPRLEIEQPDISAPPRTSTPAGPTPWVHPARSVAQRAEPNADSTRPDVVAPDSQMAASSMPIADPSTFGSEAYEPIYSN